MPDLSKEDTSGHLSPAIAQQLVERQKSYQSRKVKQPLIRLWDKDMQFIARIENQERWDYEEIAHEDGTAHVEIVGKDMAWLREIVVFQTRTGEDLHITIDPDPDDPTDWRNRWGGKVLTIEDHEKAGEPTRTVLNCISNRRHLKGILIGANPIFPMEVQIPKMFLWGGPTAFTCASTVFLNLFRLQTLNGFYLIPRNLFAPETWLENVGILNWPIQVMPMKPLQDQTRWCTIGARWKDAPTVLNPVMKDAGVICRAYTWLPGDPPPYTEVYGEKLGQIIKPRRACVILDFQDKSGVDGPTGTLLDGAINLVASTADDLITYTLRPIDADGDGEVDPFFRKIAGVAPKPSPFVYRDANYGGVKEKTLVIHKSQATDIVTGGKSPGWVNQAITFAIRYGLSQLAQVINYGLGAYQQYGSEGLDNLYQGQLDDVFLAFQRYVNPIRSAQAGPYAFREYFETGSGSAYTISAIQTLAEGDYKMRAYSSMKFDVGDGEPFILGKDFGLGDRVSAEIRGVVYTDQIMAIRAEGSRESSGRPMISFGDDSREEDPVARGFRTIANVASFAALLAGSGDMF